MMHSNLLEKKCMCVGVRVSQGRVLGKDVGGMAVVVVVGGDGQITE